MQCKVNFVANLGRKKNYKHDTTHLSCSSKHLQTPCTLSIFQLSNQEVRELVIPMPPTGRFLDGWTGNVTRVPIDKERGGSSREFNNNMQ